MSQWFWKAWCFRGNCIINRLSVYRLTEICLNRDIVTTRFGGYHSHKSIKITLPLSLQHCFHNRDRHRSVAFQDKDALIFDNEHNSRQMPPEPEPRWAISFRNSFKHSISDCICPTIRNARWHCICPTLIWRTQENPRRTTTKQCAAMMALFRWLFASGFYQRDPIWVQIWRWWMIIGKDVTFSIESHILLMVSDACIFFDPDCPWFCPSFMCFEACSQQL